jgi:hypothetical protein
MRNETAEDGRAAKKVKTDRPAASIAPQPQPKPTVIVPPSLAAVTKSSAPLPKSKSSRFGFLAQGMESVKTFASGLAKSGAGPSTSTIPAPMPRSASTSAIPKSQSKVSAAPAPPSAAPPSFATARFGFCQKEKGKALAGMTRSESFQSRPGSTLLAPTASSLAKQAASAIAVKSSTVKKSQALAARSALASTRLPQPATSARVDLNIVHPVETKAFKAGPASTAATSRSAVPAQSPLAVSRSSVSNAPVSSKTPVKRGPQFKARVAHKLSSQRATAASRPSLASGVRTPGKQRSSVSASLVQKQAATPSSLHARAGAVAARKKARESVPTTSSASAARRHSLADGFKARGRTSELVRRKPSIHTPKKIIPKAPTTPFFPAVPLGGIAE